MARYVQRRNPIAAALCVFFGAKALGLLTDLIISNITMTDFATVSTVLSLGSFVWTLVFLISCIAVGSIVFRPSAEAGTVGRLGAFILALLSALQFVDTVYLVLNQTDIFSSMTVEIAYILPAVSTVALIMMMCGLKVPVYLKVIGVLTCLPNIVSLMLTLGVEEDVQALITAGTVVSLLLYVLAIASALLWSRSPSFPADR